MRVILLTACVLAALLALPTAGRARAQEQPQQQQGARADRVVGVVVASAPTPSSLLTVRADDGRTLGVASDERTTYVRVAPGSTSLEGAARITAADLSAGDRVLVLLRAGEAGTGAPVARQVIVTSAAELSAARERQREEVRRRQLAGRVASVDAARGEFTLATRGREGAEAVVVTAAQGARFLRFAPDSMRAEDALPSSISDLRAGDQARLTGERSADGARFAATEVVSGSFVRAGGEVTSVDAARNEFTVKDELTGKTFTVALGRRSTVKRVPDELAEQFARRREEARERRGGEGVERTDAEREARREERRRERAERGERGEGRRRGGEGGPREGGPRGDGPGGGMNLQRALEALPSITLAELKRGDAVLVTGTPAATDGSRVTAVSAYTGEREFLRRLLRMQDRRGGRDPSPGLPGDVLGGGSVNREPQQTPPPN